MKATGVVRRIDDLGRIVIPKEIRRTLKISEGDSLEIYVSDEEIILKKYCFFNNSFILAQKIVDVFNKIYHKNILITDKDKVIAGPDEYTGKTLSTDVVDIINKRNDSYKKTNIIDNNKISNTYIYPIISNSDALGSVVLIDDNIDDYSKGIIKLISAILVKNIEE